jgi:hypothetical protein
LDPGEYPPAAGAFDCAAEHMASDERQDDRIPLGNGALAILGKQVEQPLYSRSLPVLATGRRYGLRTAGRYTSAITARYHLLPLDCSSRHTA